MHSQSSRIFEKATRCTRWAFYGFCGCVLALAFRLNLENEETSFLPTLVQTEISESPAEPPVPSPPPDPQGIDFAEIASAVGLNHVWPNQPQPMRPNEAFGCGCASFDFNNDGWQDILLVSDPHPVLYRNHHGARFEDVTESFGLKLSGNSDWTGCAIGDYDGDGWLDLLLTGWHRLALFRNVQGERFEETTRAAGFDPTNHNHWGASAGFMDLNSDNWLDLVILNYVEFGPHSRQFCEPKPGVKVGCPPMMYRPEKGEIWRNNRAGGFERIPHEQAMSATHGIGLVLAFADLDDDRRMDFFLGNDGGENDLLHNCGDLRFENIGRMSGVAFGGDTKPIASMGADWADYDRDGQLDLVVSNFQEQSFVLFRNLGQMSFEDTAGATGVGPSTRNRLGFGSNWIDFDNDSWPDLCFANGHVYESADNPRRQPLMLMRNEAGQKFVDLVPALRPEIAKPILGRGSGSLDFDNDGRVDLLIVDFEGPVVLLQNESCNNNHWLKLDLRASPPNVFAYGARVIGKSGSSIWISEQSPASSYLSSKDPRIHWGLGDIEKLDSLEIRWPSGQVQTLQNVAADRIVRIEEPNAEPNRAGGD